MQKHLLFTLFVLSFSALCAQDYYLVLDKHDGMKRSKLHIGQKLELELNSGLMISGPLEFVTPTQIGVAGLSLYPDSIKTLIKPGIKPFTKSLKTSAIVSIPTMLGFETLHNLANTGNRPLISKATLRLSAIFAGLGLIDFIVPKRKIPLKKKWKLRILDLKPAP